MLLAVPGAHADTVIEQASQMPDAISETAATNRAHVVDSTNTQLGDVSCRVDPPALVSQPEIDGRVIVRGEDTAAGTIECVDLFLQATDVIIGEIYVEWRRAPGDWVKVDATSRVGSSQMNDGVGVVPLLLDYVYPAGDDASGKIHRACIDVIAPRDYLPFCSEPSPVLKATV
jgi:hypothetical protein